MKKLIITGILASITIILSSCASNTGSRQDYFGYSKPNSEVKTEVT